MAGAAPDHGAQGDDGVILAAFGHFGGDQRDLKGAGDPGHGDVLRLHAVAQETIFTAAEELGDDKLVEPGGHDANLDAFADEISFKNVHTMIPPNFIFWCAQ